MTDKAIIEADGTVWYFELEEQFQIAWAGAPAQCYWVPGTPELQKASGGSNDAWEFLTAKDDELKLVAITDPELQAKRRNTGPTEGLTLHGRINEAINMAVAYGGIDGAHHKNWTIDQMVRILAQEDYEKFVAAAKAGEDGPDTYDWDVGIAP